MKEYKRKNQIEDGDLNAFRTTEINKIQSMIQSVSPKKKWKAAYFSPILIIIVALVFLLTNHQESNYLNVQKVSANEFEISGILNDSDIVFSYYVYFFQEGDVIRYNEEIQYGIDYIDIDIEPIYDVDLIAFEIDSRVFIEVIINDESTYYELDFYHTNRHEKQLLDMEFDNFYEDMNNLFDLIDTYPPLLDIEQYPLAPPIGIYKANQNINALEDTTLKQNYITYVETYYEETTYFVDHIPCDYCEEYPAPKASYAYIIAMVDEEMNYTGFDFFSEFHYIDNLVNVNPEIPENVFVEGLNYYDNEDRLINKWQYVFEGYFGAMSVLYVQKDPLDFGASGYNMYLSGNFITKDGSYDFNDVKSIKLEYTLSNYFGGSSKQVELDVIHFAGGIIIPPILELEEENLVLEHFLINYVKLTFYSDEEVQLFEIETDIVYE